MQFWKESWVPHEDFSEGIAAGWMRTADLIASENWSSQEDNIQVYRQQTGCQIDLPKTLASKTNEILVPGKPKALGAQTMAAYEEHSRKAHSAIADWDNFPLKLFDKEVNAGGIPAGNEVLVSALSWARADVDVLLRVHLVVERLDLLPTNLRRF